MKLFFLFVLNAVLNSDCPDDVKKILKDNFKDIVTELKKAKSF